MRSRTRFGVLAIDHGGLIALVVVALYVWIAPPYIVDGDNAEFSTLGTTGGIAHPSGYPLYLIWLRATSWLPAGSPAHRAAIATALLGALAVLVLHAACRAWGARPIAASITVGVFASGPLVLRFHTEAEVFALNNLVAAAVLWIAAAEGPVRGTWRVTCLALVAGLGLSNHLTCVLLAPVGILGIVRGLRETTQPRAIASVLGVAAFAAGLLPYLYLWLTPQTPASWTAIDDLGALVRHFLREDYGGLSAFAPRGVPVPAADNVLALAHTLARSWLWLPFVLGLVWFIPLARRGTEREPRWGWWMLAISVVLAGPMLASRFNKQLDAEGLYVISRFHIMPALLLALPIAIAIDQLGARLIAHLRSARLRTPVAGTIVALVVLVTSTGWSLPKVTNAYSPAMQRAIENLLHTLPPHAIVIGSFDLLYFGSDYIESALGERRDVSVITWPSTRDTIARRTGISIANVVAGDTATDQLAATLLASGRPVFADERVATILRHRPSYPYGLVFRILPDGSERPPIEDVFATNKDLYSRFNLAYPRPHMDDGLPAATHKWYARAWRIIAEALAATDHRDDALFALEMERALLPLP